ncbi:unnamed protein product (macronuclear) [Paramecium tetraurelia]|uniref:Tubulin-tyrosine ligase family protein n=1 Tax=Paramecium tetraurelia TaxID=5888 RepID=A0C046_PARTE|nr:uncharacterized protein GSPATT00006016001 [Paramecium tetraurelia]CAK64163.1 unnamed protein product [Paramecium tetraurelia]|eukprot:XP_001431561.1 hypothetical protein (macronuclear) [Paramecium tetraurelia strain d4-2]
MLSSKKYKEYDQNFQGYFKGNYDEDSDDQSKKKPTLIMNVQGNSKNLLRDTRYNVVKLVGEKIFKWKLQYEIDENQWDIFWTDASVQSETLGKMQPHQKINHFPGMFSLSRKNHLGKNLMKMKKQFPYEYKFFPKTWLLPTDYGEFRNQFVKGKAKTFIIKPEASCQGRGIFLTKDIDDIDPNDHYVAQRYLDKPFLIEGLKFDLRVYVLLAGTDPMRIYVYQDGLVRFATEPYVAPSFNNIDDVCMHLTNYAINKGNPNFIFNNDASKMDVGHKRSIKSVFGKLEEEGYNIQKLWQDIYKLIIKTFCSVQPILNHHYKSCQPDNYANNMCFEILGFDIFVNQKFQPYLLEVNHTPSFTTDTPLDLLIKKNLIRDTLILMNVNLKAKEQIIISRKEQLKQRVLTKKQQKITPGERQALIQKFQKFRDEYEDNNLGDFVKIYPLSDSGEYTRFIEFAALMQDYWTGAKVSRNLKVDVNNANKNTVHSGNNFRKQQRNLQMKQQFLRINQPGFLNEEPETQNQQKQANTQNQFKKQVQ